MQAQVLRARDFQLFGRFVYELQPDLLNQFQEQMKGETDLSKLQPYLITFCTLHCLDPDQLKGPLLKHDLTEIRKRFIECIFFIYQPHRRALSVSLANLLQVHKEQVSAIKSLFYSKCKTPTHRKDIETLANKMREV